MTRVISRFVLQKLLAEACERAAGGDFIIQNNSVVCDYEEKVSFCPHSIGLHPFQEFRRAAGQMTLAPLTGR